MPMPRVFISSVIKGFESYREAARLGVEACRCEPVMVNEDFPSSLDSSRNVCLDGVSSSDVLVTIVGSRGGSTAPSGLLVVEEEYEHAKSKQIPTYAFIQDTKRDESAEAYVKKISDFILGQHRKSFLSESDLQQQIIDVLRLHAFKTKDDNMSMDRVSSLLMRGNLSTSRATLAGTFSPRRSNEEVVDPLRLTSEEFEHDMLTMATSRNVGFFRTKSAKDTQLEGDALILWEFEGPYSGDVSSAKSVIAIHEDGSIQFEVELGDSSEHHFPGLVVTEDEIANAFRSACHFVHAFYEKFDQHHRHTHFAFDLCSFNWGQRTLLKEIPHNGSYTIEHTSHQEIRPLTKVRTLDRKALMNSEEEIGRILVMFRRKLNEKPAYF